jgi:hypothetical protein
MSISRARTYYAAFLASAAIAAAMTFGTHAISSTASDTMADGSVTTVSASCEGQAWPNYSPECLETITGRSPDRVLTARRTH